MNSPQETQLGHELRHLVSGQPFTPDIEAIGLRARRRHRRGLALRGATAAGAVALAAGGLAAAVHGPAGTAARTAVSRAPAVNSKLVSLAAFIKASDGSPPGNASLVIRTQTINGIPPEVSYNLYTDSGAFYGGGNQSSLREAIARHENLAGGIDAREVAAARYAAAGDLATARVRMVNASPNALGLGLSPAARKEIWAKAMAKDRVIFQEKGVKAPPNPPAGKLLQEDADNYVWNNGVDALSAGGGNPQVRAGVLRLLSTISGVSVVNSTTGGRPTLTLTAGPEVFGGQGSEVLTINARTGMPIKAVMPAEGKVPLSVQTFRVLRVTLADIEAGKL